MGSGDVLKRIVPGSKLTDAPSGTGVGRVAMKPVPLMFTLLGEGMGQAFPRRIVTALAGSLTDGVHREASEEISDRLATAW